MKLKDGENGQNTKGYKRIMNFKAIIFIFGVPTIQRNKTLGIFYMYITTSLVVINEGIPDENVHSLPIVKSQNCTGYGNLLHYLFCAEGGIRYWNFYQLVTDLLVDIIDASLPSS